MKKFSTSFLVIVIGVLGSILVGNAATIFTTDSSQTIGTFRTNVNTSLTNLNNAISSSSEALGNLSLLASTTGNLIVGSSTQWRALIVGSDGKILTASSTAVGGISWESSSAGIASLNGSTSSTQTFALASSSNTFSIGTSNGVHTFTFPNNLGWFTNDSGYVLNTLTLTAGAGLTGGGDLSANRTFAVGAGTGITVNADDVALTIPVSISSGGTGMITAPTAHGQFLMASGTTWIVGSLVEGSNITITTSTPGQVTIASTASGGGQGQQRFNYVLTPGGAALPNSNFAALKKIPGTNWTTYTLDYDAAVSESAFWEVSMPNDLWTGITGPGTSTLQIVGMTSSTVATTSIVRVDYRCPGSGQVWDSLTSPASATASTTWLGNGTAHSTIAIQLALTTTTFSATSTCQFEISRDVTGVDTLTNDWKFLRAILQILW